MQELPRPREVRETRQVTVNFTHELEIEVEGQWQAAEPDVGCGEHFEVDKVFLAGGDTEATNEDLAKVGLDMEAVSAKALEAAQEREKGDD